MSADKLFRDGEFAGLCNYAERLEREVERLRELSELRLRNYFSEQQRAEAAEAALREMLRQFDYMDTMESEKKACEQARAALAGKSQL